MGARGVIENFSEYPKKLGKSTLFIISGPSGAGKNTTADRLLNEKTSARLKKSITVTSRHPRPDEIDGVDYHFVSKTDFIKKLNNSEFLEYAKVHGSSYYGSLRMDVEKILAADLDALLIIDTNGVSQIKANNHDFRIITIFIAPQSLEDLRKRLLSRGTESLELIKRRLQTAKEEMEKMQMYDYILKSKTRNEDFVELLKIYQKESGLRSL